MDTKGIIPDTNYDIYQDTEENPVKPEDSARLEGFLKAKADEAELRRLRALDEGLAELIARFGKTS